MAPRTIYANLADGLQPFNLWDQSLADMGTLGVIPCIALGTNAIALTPIAFSPNVNNPPNPNQLFSFVATATSTGAVTISIVGVTGFLKLYRMDAATQAASGDIQNTVTYVVSFGSALNSNAGGFQIQSPVNNEINPIISGATITSSTFNGNTWTAGTGILTIAALKTLTASNTLTFTGTDGTSFAFPGTSDTVVTLAATQSLSNKTLVAPALGAATATSINGNTLTSGTWTLTGVAAKTLTFSNSLTLAGTDGTTMTFPATSDTVVTLAATQALTNKTVNALSISNTGGGSLSIANATTLTSNISVTFGGTASSLTLQGTGTVVNRDSTDTLTNKTFDTAGVGNSFKINGTAITANTGTVNNVLSTAPTISQPNLVGTTTNDSAAAGSVGEEIVQNILTASGVALTSGTPANIATITLTAGDWDIEAQPCFTGGATTQVGGLRSSISTTSATENAVSPNFCGASYGSVTAFSQFDVGLAITPLRVSLAGSQQYWLVSNATFSVSTCKGYGKLRARRIR